MPATTEPTQERQPPRVGEVLKESPVRRVIRAPRQGGGSLIVKTYRARGVLERLRAVWLRSRALAEARNLEEARRRGLPCPQPLRAAAGPGISPREGWLALEDLGPGTTLGHALRERPSEAVALCAAAGGLLAEALARGLDGRDWHLDNVFVDTKSALYLIDLQKVRFRRGPVRPRAVHTRGLWLGLPWPEEARARDALLAPLGGHQPAGGREIAAHLDRRLRRCLRSSGLTVREAAPDGRLFLRRRWFDSQGGPDLWQRLLATGEVLKEGRRGRVVRCSLGVGKLRGEAAALSLWRAAYALELRGVGAPRALACFAATGSRAWVLSEDLSAAMPAAQIDTLAPAERRAAIASLADSLARLHATGWRCRDLKGDNFGLLAGRAVLLDLDGVRPLPFWRRERACSGDLARLLAWARWQTPQDALGRADEIRFLARYLRARQALTGRRVEKARLVAAIELATTRWQRRHVSAAPPPHTPAPAGDDPARTSRPRRQA